MLVRLHRVPMPGIWRPDEHGRWPAWSDRDVLAAGFVVERQAERPQLEQAGLTDDEVEQVMRWLPEFGRLPVGRPTLCHGDLDTEHVRR